MAAVAGKACAVAANIVCALRAAEHADTRWQAMGPALHAGVRASAVFVDPPPQNPVYTLFFFVFYSAIATATATFHRSVDSDDDGDDGDDDDDDDDNDDDDGDNDDNDVEN